jgi:prevent-host-death family protein
MADRTMTQLEAVTGKHTTHPASDVKANWESIVEEARQQEVIVTNPDGADVVVMSASRYVALQAKARANDPVGRLYEEFRRELAPLRAPGAGDKLRAIFAATPEEMAEAANAPSDSK